MKHDSVNKAYIEKHQKYDRHIYWLDYRNSAKVTVLQHLENGDWQDCLVDGKPATAPIDI
jgi:hypothetical protein